MTDHALPEERIFEDQCRHTSYQISQRPDQERGDSQLSGGKKMPMESLCDAVAGGGKTLEKLGEHDGCPQ